MAGLSCDRKVIMVAYDLLERASCSGKAPLFDVDAHHHDILGWYNSCWMCEEAADLCAECPVMLACYAQAVSIRESWQIRAGHMWSSGRPKPLHVRRRRKS